jgi:drug/metabolite transporter (DMT)-like permease
MFFFYFLAIIAALCWAVASLISVDITRSIGGLVFNRLRLFFVSVMLVVYTTIINTWDTITFEYLNIIILSGIVGIFFGDTLLFMALQKIGPRRNNILFSLAAPFTVLLNIFILDIEMSKINLLGCFIVFIGVVIAIAYGSNKNSKHRWESIQGSLIIGIIFGILAALCQAVGLIMMKPILNAGVDPIASAAIRTLISCILLSFTFLLKSKNFVSKEPISLSIVKKSIISGFLGMALGMSLLLVALQKADAGIVATLSSTSPIMILFLIWILTKKVPSLGAWIGTILAIIGTGLIFIY